MPVITVNNVELHYEQFGSGGPPVVLVHGFLASSNMWMDYFVPHLSGSYRVFALDMRGHGRSGNVTFGCTVKQLADDVYKFSQQLHIEKAIFIGMSMGGAVSIQFAIDHPNRLKALIVMNTGFGSPLLKESKLVTLMIGFMAQRRWLLRQFIRKAFTRSPSDKMILDFLNDAILVSKETCIEYIHHTNKISHWENLSTFEPPALVLIGGKDTVSPFEQQSDLAETLPNSTKIVLEHEGHAMFLENPDAVFNEISLFLDHNSL